MCRLILNAISIKYAGIVVSVGEHDQSCDEYLEIAHELHLDGGHAGARGSMVLKEAKNTLRRMKTKAIAKEQLTRFGSSVRKPPSIDLRPSGLMTDVQLEYVCKRKDY